LSALKVTGKAWHNFMSTLIVGTPSKDKPVLGFSDIEFIEPKKLIELDGSIVEYYDFGKFLVIPKGDKGQQSRMIADKKISVYLHDGDLNILDFVFYSDKLKESK
jgi:hypothetical protein